MSREDKSVSPLRNIATYIQMYIVLMKNAETFTFLLILKSV
jgi:hypothetical protein